MIAALIALSLYGVINPPARPLTTADVQDTITQTLASASPTPPLAEQVYAVARPSLVLIETHVKPGGAAGRAAPSPSEAVTNKLGSGVVIDDRGDILTSLHVVADADSIQLTFADGTKSAGRIVGQQVDNDTAVLQAQQPPAQLVPATLGNPNALQIGSDAYVVGNPLGLTGSLTAGVVSGLDRSFKSPETNRVLHGLIQVDAAVNPGNSGGPLLNREGQVVGIVTALINPTKQDVFIGIGLAVPITTAGGAAGLPPY
jgi:S1-C subfamily serine protease